MRTFLFLLLLFSSTISWAIELSEGQETNGGDAYAAEFSATLDSAIARMPPTMILADGFILNRDLIQTTRLRVKVTSSEKLYLRGHEVSAINQPRANPPLIVISRKMWRPLDSNQKLHLVIHEVLPVAGIFDANYVNSMKVIQQLQDEMTLNYFTLEKFVAACDQGSLATVTEDAFKAVTTPSQRLSLLLLALGLNCSPVIKYYETWNINMDICVGKLSLLNWYLRQATMVPAAFDVLNSLVHAKVPASRVCYGTLNNLCEANSLRKLGAKDAASVREILNCR